MANTHLLKAKNSRNDEFYTQYRDIELEIPHYGNAFKGKLVYCNCDNWEESNFFKYFKDNFLSLGLAGLTATFWKKKNVDLLNPKKTESAMVAEYDGTAIKARPLKGDGDFRSGECRRILEKCDIVVTNPPYSLFREYISMLIESGKRFLVIGPQNACYDKDLFPLIMSSKVWWGCNCIRWFITSHRTQLSKTTENGEVITEGDRSRWWTNLHHDRMDRPLELKAKYSPEAYPKYDNYNAIEVGNVSDIPNDYEGVMGVPITFLDKYDQSQFEIVGRAENLDRYGLKTKMYTTQECRDAHIEKYGKDGLYNLNKSPILLIDGKLKVVYNRIFIKKANHRI